MKANKLGALFAVLAVALLVGCTETFTPDEVNVMLESQSAEMIDSFQTQFNAALTTQDELRGQLAELTVNLETEKANSAKVAELETKIAELQTNLEAAEEVTDAVTEAKVEVEEGIYFLIEDVPLDGDFDCSINGIDNDDLSILSYSDVEYNDDTIDFEEKLYFTADFKPELNVEDFGSEVLVGMANEGAIKYMLEFDDPIVFVADEELDIEFLGQAYTLVSYTGGKLTFRVSDKYEGSYGDELTVDGQIVKILEIDGEGEKVRIQVGDETEIIKLGDEKEVGGLSIYVDDVFVATIPKDMAWVSLYIGEDIVQEVYDTDEFMETDDWEWVIIDDNNGDGNLTSLGVVYVEDIVDEEDMWHLGDGMCFPLDYVCTEFSEVKNADVLDLKLDVSKTKLKVNFDGKIEIAGDRIDDAKFTVELATLEYEYYYKGTKETGKVLTDIVFFQEDRELNFDMNYGELDYSYSEVWSENGDVLVTVVDTDDGWLEWTYTAQTTPTTTLKMTVEIDNPTGFGITTFDDGSHDGWYYYDTDGIVRISDYDGTNRISGYDWFETSYDVDSMTVRIEKSSLPDSFMWQGFANFHKASNWIELDVSGSPWVPTGSATIRDPYWVRIFDAGTGMNYNFKFDAGEFTQSIDDATEMNEDNDYRMLNGDILYKSEVNELDNDDKVSIGFVSDEALEVILRVE